MNLSASNFFGIKFVLTVMTIAASMQAARSERSTSAATTHFGAPPLYFEAHGPQGFVARGADCSVSLLPTEAAIVLQRRSARSPRPIGHRAQSDDSAGESRIVRMIFEGANAGSALMGIEQLAGTANYLLGSDSSQWRTGVPLFAKARVNGIYPGVDLVYYADQSARLEYDFILQPGAGVEQIAFRIEGADRVRINANGELVLKVGTEEIRQLRPVIFQQVNGTRQAVEGGYRLLGKSTVGFRVSDYDRNLPLVIDPVLSFSTYLGGLKTEYGWALAADGANNIYVAGETLSKFLPGTNGVFQPIYAGGSGPFGDAFVAKYDAVTKGLVYLTYLGGKTHDGARGLAVDNDGNAYVTGFTDSRNFPVLPASNQMTLDTLAGSGRAKNAFRIFPINAFIARLNATGTALDFSVLLGGNRRDSGTGIALDAGDVFVTGMTESTNFSPISTGAQPLHGGNADAFVVRLTNPADPTPVYSTYLGGTNLDFAESIAVRSGEAYVTGYTVSTNFPIVNPLSFTNASSTNLIVMNQLNMQPRRSVRTDAFVTRLSSAGSQFLYSTYLGGTNDDAGLDIKVDSTGNAHVTGYTFSRVFPTNAVVTPVSTGSNYNSHVFVAKIAPEGSNLVYSVDFGSSRSDRGAGLDLDEANGRVYVTGFTSWNNFFATNSFEDLRSTNAIAKRTSRTPNDAFVVALQETGGTSPLNFTNALLFGGTGNDLPNSMVVRTVGPDVLAWVAGQTTSPNFVITNQYPPFLVQTNLGNTVKKNKAGDAFLTEFIFP
jgi:hypothetical protein